MSHNHLSLKEAAKYANLTYAHFRALVLAGQGPPFYDFSLPGSKNIFYRFITEKIDLWIKKRKRSSTQEAIEIKREIAREREKATAQLEGSVA